MSSEEPPQPDVETSDDQHNSKDGPNASRKGQPWTEEEHLAFLQGLKKLGKGNWRAIAKSFVPSRTPTQVASHAQKHYMRIAGATKRKSRFTALEVEVGAPPAAVQAGDAEHRPHPRQPQAPEQPSQLQRTAFQGGPAVLPAVPFPFMHPMMFGFPGPLFPPMMCPPPAFAAAVMSAMQKQGGMPMMMPPVFPMAAAMMAMNPFFMAQQMAAAAQAAAANTAAAAHAATSGGGTSAATAPTASNDTASSDELLQRTQSAALGSPRVCRPEAQHARPVTAGAASSAGTASGRPVGPCQPDGKTSSGGAASGSSREGAPSGQPQVLSGSLTDQVSVQMVMPVPVRPVDGVGSFHKSSLSAFRPPQDIKTEN